MTSWEKGVAKGFTACTDSERDSFLSLIGGIFVREGVEDGRLDGVVIALGDCVVEIVVGLEGENKT